MLHALPVIRDFGAVGDGVSQARYVKASNGVEYIIKGPSLVPGHPQVAANEFIGAYLAECLEVPVVDHRLLSFGGRLFFGSARMGPATFTPMTKADFDRSTNKDVSYLLIVLDVIIRNIDRHQGNLLLRWLDPNDKSGECLVVANDHSHCLVLPGQSASDLSAFKDEFPKVCSGHLDYVNHSVQEPDLLRQAIDHAQAIADREISDLVESLPGEFLSPTDKTAYKDFLLHRKNSLRVLIERNRHYFQQLKAGVI